MSTDSAGSRRADPASRRAGGDALATVVQRVAVLLAAGVAPSNAWRHAGMGTVLEDWADALGRQEPGRVADLIASDSGDAVAGAGSRRRAAEAASRAARAGLAATWAVSVESGAPLAASLRNYATLLRGFAEAGRSARVALSGPKATSRLVLVMPVLGLVLGAMLGQDMLGVLFGTPLGLACLLIGSGLMTAAWAWNRALLRRAAVGDRLPGLLAELVATAMSGGVSADRARTLVAAAAARYRIAADFTEVESAMRVATSAGAPVAELLRAEAEEARRTALAEAAERAERLSVSLMLPLGACVLPAFLALGVIPLMVGIVSSTIAAI